MVGSADRVASRSHPSPSGIRRPRVLIAAEHASARLGGEPLIPFQYFKKLREAGADVHLLVHERTRDELLKAFPHDRDRLHFIRDSRVNIWCHKLGSFLPDRLAVFTLGAVSHLETQFRQRKLARSLVRDLSIDIVHETIPVSPRMPSLLFNLEAKVIIGPMNGGMDYPPNYETSSWLERVVIAVLRSTASFWNYVIPGKREATLLLVANQRTYDALPAGLKRKPVRELAENGVDPELFKPFDGAPGCSGLRVIYVGRLVDWKRPDLLIEACARLDGSIDFQLDIVGDGVLRPTLEEQVRYRSLQDRVRFHGWLDQPVAAEFVRRADVMVLPSMRECGGAVVLEAMASAVPVIAAAWGGPMDYLSAETGVLIPPASPAVFVEELAKALRALAGSPEDRVRLGQAARRRASNYDWNHKVKMLLDIYSDVLRD
jgi:glycosyltransferase involved in cell wall biosynthesis